MLTADSVSFRYDGGRGRPAVPVLAGVSVAVARGSRVGILGPNGSGKTTLLKLLAGILRPASGAVRLDGRDISTYSRPELARRLAIVPQETHPAFEYSVTEIVLMGRYAHLGPFALEGPEDLRVASDAMRATGTEALAARGFDELSGGEKQRVVIASALAQAAEVLLLDEPTASLDLAFQLEIADLLRRLNRDRGVTLVLSSHDLNLVASVCDTLVLLRGGRLLGAGPPREVLTRGMIRALYDVDADVHEHPRAGHLTIVPVRHAGAS